MVLRDLAEESFLQKHTSPPETYLIPKYTFQKKRSHIRRKGAGDGKLWVLRCPSIKNLHWTGFCDTYQWLLIMNPCGETQSSKRKAKERQTSIQPKKTFSVIYPEGGQETPRSNQSLTLEAQQYIRVQIRG